MLRLDGHAYSPTVLHMIVEAAGTLQSFANASYALRLAGVPISARHVERLTHEIGNEMAQQRDAKVVQRRQRQLPARGATQPQVVAVEVDGGRLRTRATACGPGVHEAKNKEDKIACLVSLQSDRQEQDPQPEPPESFTQPRRVQRLVREIKGLPSVHPKESADPEAAGEPPQPEKKASPVKEAPEPLLRTCVASMHKSRLFGPMVAAEAQERGFYQAPRRAFLGDGLGYNWSIHKAYFSDFEPIVDFVHVLCYLYLAAWATGGDPAQVWLLYLAWLHACWQGRVREVIAELRVWQEQVGKPPQGEKLKEFDPRRLLAEALSYLGNNAKRMDYPRYRKEGLPITSSLVESQVGEFNSRVKGGNKFWNRAFGEGAETILQVRAAVLSEDDRLSRHFAERKGSLYRQKRSGAGRSGPDKRAVESQTRS